MFGRSAEEKAIEKGLDFQNDDKFEKAEQEFKRALEINPDYSDAYYYLGVLYKIQGDTEKATESYEKALEIEPTNSRARYMLKLLTDADSVLSTSRRSPSGIQGDTNTPVPEINRDKIKEELKDDIRQNYLKAVQLAKEEKLTESISFFERTVKLNPNNFKARYNLAVAYLRLGHPVKATAQLRQAIKINPQYAPAKTALGKITKGKSS